MCQRVGAAQITVKCYTSSTGCVDAGIATGSGVIKLFVYGSEFGKADTGMN